MTFPINYRVLDLPAPKRENLSFISLQNRVKEIANLFFQAIQLLGAFLYYTLTDVSTIIQENLSNLLEKLRNDYFRY